MINNVLLSFIITLLFHISFILMVPFLSHVKSNEIMFMSMVTDIYRITHICYLFIHLRRERRLVDTSQIIDRSKNDKNIKHWSSMSHDWCVDVHCMSEWIQLKIKINQLLTYWTIASWSFSYLYQKWTRSDWLRLKCAFTEMTYTVTLKIL